MDDGSQWVHNREVKHSHLILGYGLRLQRVRQAERVTSSFARGESRLAVVNVYT